MEVITEPGGPSLGRVTPPALAGGSAVTIGAFDGVHLGHLAVLRDLRRRAAALGHPTVLVTFDRHPAQVVRPESAPELLTDLNQKLELLEASGQVDYAVVLRFDAQRAAEEADAFIEEVLVEALHARLVVVGEDFHFGRRRGGNVALLRRRGAERGFEVVGLRLVPAGGGPSRPVSSTAIRELLHRGDVAAAAELLGRPHEVRGVVTTGDQRGGRELGFPTANVTVPPDILLPADGIYAGWYQRPDGTRHRAAISRGRRPTFHPDAVNSVLEAYLLDFDGDLYGERARVCFVARLRDEQRFDSADQLVHQMKRDVEAAREALAG
ncbi:MAG: bifunctional riboflavin kinase/FAD synthetase [Actinomycetota bacterium]|nr:bifunctional riboflavin kinase/FAD synthetase [Actinomycetota bacterium]